MADLEQVAPGVEPVEIAELAAVPEVQQQARFELGPYIRIPHPNRIADAIRDEFAPELPEHQLAQLVERLAAGYTSSFSDYAYTPAVAITKMRGAPLLLFNGDGTVNVTTNAQGQTVLYMHMRAAEQRPPPIKWRFELTNGNTPELVPSFEFNTSVHLADPLYECNVSELVRNAVDTALGAGKDVFQADAKRRLSAEWFAHFKHNHGPSAEEHARGVFIRERGEPSHKPRKSDTYVAKIAGVAQMNRFWWQIVANDSVSILFTVEDVPLALPRTEYLTNISIVANHRSTVGCLTPLAVHQCFIEVHDRARVDMTNRMLADILRVAAFGKHTAIENVRVSYIAYGAKHSSARVSLSRVGARSFRFINVVADALAVYRESDVEMIDAMHDNIGARTDTAPRRARASDDELVERGDGRCHDDTHIAPANYPESTMHLLNADSYAEIKLMNVDGNIDGAYTQTARVQAYWKMLFAKTMRADGSLQNVVDAVLPIGLDLLLDKDRAVFPIDCGRLRAQIVRPRFVAGKDRQGIASASPKNPYHQWIVSDVQYNRVDADGRLVPTTAYCYVRIGTTAFNDLARNVIEHGARAVLEMAIPQAAGREPVQAAFPFGANAEYRRCLFAHDRYVWIALERYRRVKVPTEFLLNNELGDALNDDYVFDERNFENEVHGFVVPGTMIQV